MIESPDCLENEVYTGCGQRTGLVNDRNTSNLAIRITEPNHKFGQICWSRFEHIQVPSREKAVIPQQSGAICLHGGRGAIRGRFPIQKRFGIGDEIAPTIDQVIHSPSAWHVSGYHSGDLTHFYHLSSFVSSLVFVLL